MTDSQRINARVQALRYEAEGVVSVELHPLQPAPLPGIAAGAHIDLHLANGLVRSYSLVTPRCAQTHYVVLVLLDQSSRGGSRYIHQELRVGQTLTISAPRNHFPLNEAAKRTVLIGGGIGITPIFSMFARLVDLKHPVHLLYCLRSRAHMALQEDLKNLGLDFDTHIDDEVGHPPDLKAYLQGFSADADFYCCGPAAMLDKFEQTCAALNYPNVHIERFAAAPQTQARAPSGAYEVVLARSQRTLQIAAGQSLHEVFQAAGVQVEFSCRAGICGSCETKVLEGQPDHRDAVLTKSEQAANKTMMVCVSGCKGNRLVLDL